MAVWTSSNIILTQKGQELLSKVQSGVGQLTITRVVTGSGRVSPENLFYLTEVSSIRQTMTIAKVTTMSTGSNLELRVTNADVVESYKINQIGVYASHPDMGEVLYMIAQCDEGTADIVPLPSVTPVTMNYMFYLIHSSATQVDITVNPDGFVPVEKFEEHLDEFQELCDFVGYNDSEIYGVEVDFENKTYTRLGANVGLTPGEDFDSILPWGGRERCIIANDGTVLATYGSDGYSETGYTQKDITIKGVKYPKGTVAQVMVKQPKFWYKTIPIKLESQQGQQGYSLLKAKYYISPTPRPGFKLFPLFKRGSQSVVEADVAYLPAYLGSAFDASTPRVSQVMVLIADYSPYVVEGAKTLVINLNDEEKVKLEVSEGASREEIMTRLSEIKYNTVNAELIYYTGVEGDTVPAVRYTYKEPGFKGESNSIQHDWEYVRDGTKYEAYAEEFRTVVEVKGAGGYDRSQNLAGFNPSSYKTVLSSVAGSKPLRSIQSSQLGTTHLSGFRQLCRARNSLGHPEGDSWFREELGFGWQLKDLSANMCSAMLFLIEYASLDARSKVGEGISESGSPYHCTGETSSLGNSTGTGVPIESDDYPAVSYRGEENLWGFYYQCEDGLSIYSGPGETSICHYYFSSSGTYADGVNAEDITHGYKSTGFTVAPEAGYTNRIGYSEDFDWGFLPTLNKGSSNHPIHSYNYLRSVEEVTRLSSTYVGFDPEEQTSNLCSRYFAPKMRSTTGASLLFVPDPLTNATNCPTGV